MQVSRAGKFPKVRLTNDQVKLLRSALNCQYRPVQYAGGIMFWQGGGWYEISSRRLPNDWATDTQMMNALIRKIREVLNAPEMPKADFNHTPVGESRWVKHVRALAAKVEAPIDYSKPNVGKHFIDAGLPIPVDVPVPSSTAAVQYDKPISTGRQTTFVDAPKVEAAPVNRLEALARRINNKYHHA